MASRLELGEDATSLGWFCVREVVSGVWLLGEPQHVYTWLVAGDDRAVLLDTGMERMGDRAWRDLLAEHYQRVQAILGRFRGREVDSAGDGVLAVFDGPARAVKCGLALREAVEPLGLQVRVGIHAGEVELDGPAVRGIAVHIGARVAGEAAADEVLVSSTVRDLVAGSGLEFEDRGEHELKGIGGRWRLHAALPPPPQPFA
jgi:class 3 adenylate cyclase